MIIDPRAVRDGQRVRITVTHEGIVQDADGTGRFALDGGLVVTDPDRVTVETLDAQPTPVTTAPNEHHHIRFTIDSGGSITAHASCTAPEGADCRSWCTCDQETCHCEHPNVIDRGECGRIPFLNDDDPVDYYYRGPDGAPVRDGGIGLIWDGDGYTWRYLDQVVTKHTFDDGGLGITRCRHVLRKDRWPRNGVVTCDLGLEWHAPADATTEETR